MGPRRIACLLRVWEAQVHGILNGLVTEIPQRLHDHIMGFRPVHADGSRVSAWRTVKLLKALEVEGWSRRDVAQMLGDTSKRPLRIRGRSVRRSTARQVESLYRRLMGEDLEGTWPPPLPDLHPDSR
jgi:hypothetical protein